MLTHSLFAHFDQELEMGALRDVAGVAETGKELLLDRAANGPIWSICLSICFLCSAQIDVRKGAEFVT